MASRRYDAADGCEHVLGNQEQGDEKMDAGSAVRAAAEQGFKLLDKVTEFRFALVILSVAIALDVALAWIANRNVLTMDWSTLGADGMGKLGLVVVIYIFWMAALSTLYATLWSSCSRCWEILAWAVRWVASSNLNARRLNGDMPGGG